MAEDKHQLFIDYYCGEARGIATRAAQMAGYTHPKQEGWRLKQQPDIRAAIDERLAAHTLTQTEILARWTEVADATLGDFYTVHYDADGKPDYIREDLKVAAVIGKMHLVKAIKETKYGTQILLHDKMTALGCLARARGVLSDLPQKKLEELLDALIAALPEEFRRDVRERVADALAAGRAGT